MDDAGRSTDPQQEFLVRATAYDRGHVLDIAGVGVTQTCDEDAASADEMVRDYLAARFGRAPDSFAVRIEYEMQEGPTADYV